MRSHKQTYYSDEDFTLSFEIANDVAFLHCDVRNWCPSSLKRGYRVFAKLERECREAGMPRMATITPNPAFAKLFGGETFEEFEYDGQQYQVVVWDLK